MTSRQVILLSKDMFDRTWHQFDEVHLEKWMNDGSIKEGDKLIFTNEIMEVTMERKLRFAKQKKQEMFK